MNKFKKIILVMLSHTLFSTVSIAASSAEIEGMTELIIVAKASGAPAPVLNLKWGAALDVDSAYRVQKAVVAQWLGASKPAGFKAGLTSGAAQEKFSVDHAVAGVLLPGGGHISTEGRYAIKLSEFKLMMMEAEIGFLLSETISAPIASVEVLKSKVALVLPVVEFPDLAFDDRKALQGVDIIANNVAAKQFLPGAERVLEDLDINELTVIIRKDGEPILEASSADAMGDQWQALLWLVNQTVANGWKVEQGQLLITGALGKMLPAKAGFYQVDYGALGQIDFMVE